MTVNKLRVLSFRNIDTAEIDFSNGVNLLYGNNAEGKTNALEAIYYFARGRSFRTPRDLDLVSFGRDFFSLSLDFLSNGREKSLSVKIGKGVRERKQNGIPFSRVSEMMGVFRSVLFCPEHLSLIKGGPEERRSFLNIALSQLYPNYVTLYMRYGKLLEERNAILKSIQKGLPFDQNELSVWSQKLAEAARDIYLYRRRYIEALEGYAKRVIQDISGEKEELSLSYRSDVTEGEDPLSSYMNAFSSHLEREAAAGTTLFGVHRDDMEVLLNGVSARSFASQGQQRSLVLTLKTAEGEVSRQITGEYPVFLFDDVLSELDQQRQDYIFSSAKGKQIILTSCSEGLSREPDTKILVKGGHYVSAYR